MNNNCLDKIPNSISWDNYFMSLAFLISTKSHDPNTKIGCVLRFDDKTFVTGFNGCPKNFNDTLLYNCNKYDFVIHSEENALYMAGLEKCRHQNDLTLYVIIKPCPKCAIKLVHFNVKRVVYYSDYKSNINNDELLEKIRHRGGLSGEPAFTLEKYTGELLFSHNHMGVK